MNAQVLLPRLQRHFGDILGLHLQGHMETDERQRQVRITGWMGIFVGSTFSIFNMLTPGMATLGHVELAAVIFLLVPAIKLARQPRWVDLAEGLMLGAALVILSGLVVFGGIEGTGLYWTYTAPFVAFFLKGQKQGWWYGSAFVLLAGVYFGLGGHRLPFAYHYPPDTALHYLLSLAFYTLLAANFNLLRSRFEDKLTHRVATRTAEAQKLLTRLQYLATHDETTGLPNRVRLLELLPPEIAVAQASGQGLVVCTMRLERLMEFDNVLGSAGADSVIKQVTAQLAQMVAGHGVLARVRRDEFTVTYRTNTTHVDAPALARYLARQHIPVHESGLSLYIELTLGLAMFPEHGQDPATLLKKAEQALLQARKNAQRWSVYDAHQDQLFTRHHLLFGKLRDAILQHQLSMHFQPQIDLCDGRVIGAEALVRWRDPVEGPISPAEFIPVAEESGLIRPLTLWVLAESMRECARWHSVGLALDVSINLSALNLLDPELPDALHAALAETALPPKHVNLEITESCFMASPQRTMSTLQDLHATGFRLSIDDFGTGYSSLSYLKSMPIDELKIDQSFVRKLLTSQADQAIVDSTIALAHNFGLRVVAEESGRQKGKSR